MHSTDLQPFTDGEEATTLCTCCGESVFEGTGTVRAGEVDVADYWYHMPAGHLGRFTLSISLCDEAEAPIGAVTAISGQVGSENITYAVLDAEASHWTDTTTFGPILNRADVLGDPRFADWFFVVDAITAGDNRISSRILGFAKP